MVHSSAVAVGWRGDAEMGSIRSWSIPRAWALMIHLSAAAAVARDVDSDAHAARGYCRRDASTPRLTRPACSPYRPDMTEPAPTLSIRASWKSFLGAFVLCGCLTLICVALAV